MNKKGIIVIIVALAVVLAFIGIRCMDTIMDESNNASQIADGVSVECIREEYSQYGIVQCHKDKVVKWEFTTPTTAMTELQSISEVYQNNNTVYIAAVNILYALDSETGNVKWQVSDVGASNSIIFDKHGNIYISGYYGPNVKVIDSGGNVLYSDISNEYYWVHNLEIDGNTLNIYYESETGGMKTLDISQFAE